METSYFDVTATSSSSLFITVTQTLLFLLPQYKLCKVKKIMVGTKGIPHLVTHDARTIRYPDPLIKVNDTVRIDLDTNKITEFIKFDTGRFTAAGND